jgi:integrase
VPGSILTSQTRSGKKRYEVHWRDPERRLHEKAFSTRRDADLFLASVQVSIAKGEYIDAKASKVLIDDLGREWLTSRTHLKPSSLRPLEIAWRLHVSPLWGKTPVGGVQHSRVQTWVSKLGTQPNALSATSVIRAYGVLASILDVAVKDRRIHSNPARGVNLPRKQGKPRVYLTHAQVDLLAGQAGDKGGIVLALAYTGLRWGELTGLRVRHVDTVRRRFLTAENAVDVGGTIHVGTPKSHESRSVPYPAFLDDLVLEALSGKTRDKLAFGDGERHLRLPHSQRGWFASSVRKSQAFDAEMPRVTPHDLRHTAASLAISAGANVKAVQRMLGHASAAMTLDTYADLFPDDLDAVAESLNSAREKASVGFLLGREAA